MTFYTIIFLNLICFKVFIYQWVKQKGGERLEKVIVPLPPPPPPAATALIFLFKCSENTLIKHVSVCLKTCCYIFFCQALIGLVTFDLAGLLLRWKLFDHAAHLGGIIFGRYNNILMNVFKIPSLVYLCIVAEDYFATKKQNKYM